MTNYTYMISRSADNQVIASVRDDDSNGWSLNPRTDLFLYSSKFDFGNFGSGSAQLSIAMLAHHLSDVKRFEPFEFFAPRFPEIEPYEALVFKLHIQFKSRVISKVSNSKNFWEITSNEIDTIMMGMIFPHGISVQA